MTKGTRLLIMVLVLIGVVIGMMQCAAKTMHRKKIHPQDGRAPMPVIYLAAARSWAGSGP
jgi:uncharacterized alpha/beta hydrolase family protein